MAAQVKKEVKEGHFASTSEFFRHMLRLWNTEKVLRDIKASERDFARGRFKVLKSFKDLQ